MVATKDTVDFAVAVAPAAIRTSTVTGSAVDLANYSGNSIVINVGTITDGTHTPKLQESDASGSGYTDIAAADQVGTLAALASSTFQKVSYIGGKRYIRLVVTVTGSPATGGYYDATACLRGSRVQP